MSKFGAFIILLILIGVVGYIYYQNTNDIGVKIEKLKLRYAISPASDPESIMSFSEAMGDLSVTTAKQRQQVEFEKNYWSTVSINKAITKYMTNDGLFGKDCKDTEFSRIVKNAETAKTNFNTTSTLYDYAKNTYNISKQKDWENKLDALAYAIQVNYDVLYTICPAQ